MGTWVLRLLLALWELWAGALKAAVQRSGLSICGYARTSSPLDWGACVCVSPGTSPVSSLTGRSLGVSRKKGSGEAPFEDGLGPAACLTVLCHLPSCGMGR